MDALIVGAGAAGLAAARELSVAGCKVTVVEARDRIGGRVYTYKDPAAPIPIELGAEFVHGKSPYLWHLAERANLKLQEVSERHWYFEGGKLNKSHDFWKQIEKLNDEMKACDSDQSLKDFLATLPDDKETQRAKDTVTRYVEGFHAANIERIGIQGIVKANEAADSINGDKSFRFLDGYDSLTQVLWAEAETCGATIHLNTVVKEIHWGERRSSPTVREGVSSNVLSHNPIEAVCEQNNQQVFFNASCAIITLPLGVLQHGDVRFVPDLPREKLAAINNLVMGDVLRIVVRFRERFWEDVKFWDEETRAIKFAEAGFIHYPDAPIPTWWTQLPIRAPILVGWAGGPRTDALDRGSSPTMSEGASVPASAGGSPHNSTTQYNEFILDQALASLSRIFNVSVDTIHDQSEAAYSHGWRADPFSRGAYSYVPVNGLGAQQNLSAPVANRLFFAGEATSIGHVGTVHGAIQSGQRAAKEFLDSNR